MRNLQGGVTLVELLIDDNCHTPEIQSVSNGIRIRVPTAITYEEIMSELGSSLTSVQSMIIFDLWCNDAALRHFNNTPDGVVVRLREMRTSSSSIKGANAYGRPLLTR